MAEPVMIIDDDDDEDMRNGGDAEEDIDLAGLDVDQLLGHNRITKMSQLDSFLDAQINDLNIEDAVCEALEGSLTATLRKAQEDQNQINTIFDECQEALDKYQHELEAEDNAANEEPTVIGSDSDDDVQFVDANFDIESRKTAQLKALEARAQRQLQNFPRPPALMRAPQAAGMRMNFAPRMPSMTQGGMGPPIPGVTSPNLAPSRTHLTSSVDLAAGMKLYGKKWNDCWYKGTLVEIQNKEMSLSERKYKVKFDVKGWKVLTGKQIAYADIPGDLPPGARIIALFHDEDSNRREYYAGIIAEPPNVRNGMRYLTFFDDGYAQYCTKHELHRVCEQSKNVWDDIHPDSQEFIRNYLQQYPERPMVRLQVSQIVKTEWNGQWWIARVQEVDSSLVKMYFDADKRIEWIYRGSTRLEPLYTELKNAEASKQAGKGIRHNRNLKGTNKPLVEYTRLDTGDGADKAVVQKKRAVARKSTNKSTVQQPPPPPPPAAAAPGGDTKQQPKRSNDMATMLQDRFQAEPTQDDWETHGQRLLVPGLKAELTRPRKSYVSHRCSKKCLGNDDDPVKHKGQNPLLIPLLCGWERQIAKQKNTYKKVVFYRAPCGKRIRNIHEMDRFLMITDSRLTVDLYCYDPMVHLDTEFVPVKTYCDIKDLSYGKENVPISCVNGVDRVYPDYVDYSNVRTPGKGVEMNLDPEFLVGCDCTDGCRDATKCACMQRTIEATNATPGGKEDKSAGYKFRRLKECLTTGIHECNQKCKCCTTCHNRVAQNGLQLRLQVYKTENRGWGLRCLDDIPSGGFICVYAGQILTEQCANEDGQAYGDEYFAELDYIEVVERNKEGYESDVKEEDMQNDAEYEEEEDAPYVDPDSDSDYSNHQKPTRRKSRGKKQTPSTPDHGTQQQSPAFQSQKSSPSTWTVRTMPLPQKTGVTPHSTLQKKTLDWVNSIPTPQGTPPPPPPADECVIILSESDDDVPGQVDGTCDVTPDEDDARDQAMSTENDDVMDDVLTIGQIDGAGDEKTTSPTGKRRTSSSKKEGEAEEGIAGLVITEPTSLNIDMLPEEEEDVEPGEVEYSIAKEAPNLRRTTRSQTIKVTDMPDPRAQKNKVKNKGDEEEEEDDDDDERAGTRRLFGDHQYCYVMDAKAMGNLGRYLNHSCSPNVFVQNVFVDTHDLRFPWVAFFASQFIRAGSELTWDYNYEVGSVPGKILYCYCGAAECRGRLL